MNKNRKNIPKLPKKILNFIIYNHSFAIIQGSWDVNFTKLKLLFETGITRELTPHDIEILKKNGFPPRYKEEEVK